MNQCAIMFERHGAFVSRRNRNDLVALVGMLTVSGIRPPHPDHGAVSSGEPCCDSHRQKLR